MATIKDVARESGVSIATVSAVINEAAWVSDATRVRVQEAIDETGYRPNRLARSLKTKQGYAVGAIVSYLSNPFFTEVVRGLSHRLREHDRNLFLCDSDDRFELGAANFRILLEKHVDAIVLIGATVQEDVLRAYMQGRHRIPIIAVERDYAMEGVHTLLVDSEKGGFEATTHLIEQSYQRIAMITGPEEGPGSETYGRKQRFEGYQRALQTAGRSVEPSLIVSGDFHYEGGQKAMEELLRLPEPPDAVFASNDLMAFGALSVARDASLSVPHDLGLVGYDDIPLSGLASPGLTTMAMPKQALGTAAADLLQELLTGNEPAKTVRRMFDAELVVRQSTQYGKA